MLRIHQSHRRPGPIPKGINNTTWTLPQPTQRVERSYSKEKKVAILLFRHHHRVLAPNRFTYKLEYRQPTFQECGAYFKVPPTTIGQWWAQKEAILASKGRFYHLDRIV